MYLLYTVLLHYYRSLPAYLNTVRGQCTTVVLDTSNKVYCIVTLMECTVQCIALASLIGQCAFFIWRKASYVYTLIYNTTTLNAYCTISIGISNPIWSRMWGGQFGNKSWFSNKTFSPTRYLCSMHFAFSLRLLTFIMSCLRCRIRA